MRSIVLVTGAAGFIGFHLSQKLCQAGFTVLGIDNLNDYYDVKLKESRLKILESESNFIFDKLDLVDYKGLTNLFGKYSAIRRSPLILKRFPNPDAQGEKHNIPL